MCRFVADAVIAAQYIPTWTHPGLCIHRGMLCVDGGGAVQVDPSLESDWFQPLNLSSEKLVPKCGFKMQLAPLHGGVTNNLPALCEKSLRIGGVGYHLSNTVQLMTAGICPRNQSDAPGSDATTLRVGLDTDDIPAWNADLVPSQPLAGLCKRAQSSLSHSSFGNTLVNPCLRL